MKWEICLTERTELLTLFLDVVHAQAESISGRAIKLCININCH